MFRLPVLLPRAGWMVLRLPYLWAVVPYEVCARPLGGAGRR
ncbi:hypothetical protein [Nonomuraea sp. NPDC005650]